MKISLFGIQGIPLGKHNVKDPRLDQADKLVEAQKKTCAQVDVVEDKEMITADAVLTTRAALSDLLVKDLDAVETRLSRNPSDAEKAVLQKLADGLISEKPVSAAGLAADEIAVISAHNFYSNRPVVVASEAELAAPDALIVRAFRESGYISFLTVGGKENRAWPICKGTTAWEAGGVIHSDIQKGFIRAEIMAVDDLLRLGSEREVKAANLYHTVGKDHVMRDGDEIVVRFSV